MSSWSRVVFVHNSHTEYLGMGYIYMYFYGNNGTHRTGSYDSLITTTLLSKLPQVPVKGQVLGESLTVYHEIVLVTTQALLLHMAFPLMTH